MQIAIDSTGEPYIAVRHDEIPDAVKHATSQGYEAFDPEEVEPEYLEDGLIKMFLYNPQEVFSE